MKVRSGLFLGLAVSLFACEQKAPEPPPPPAAPPPPPVAAAPVEPEEVAGAPGGLKITVAFEGVAPAPKALDRNADPFCAKSKKNDESLVVNPNNTLQNVVVKLTKGVKGTFETPVDPIIIDQVQCMYTPRVQTAVTGQKMLIKNGDSTLHNIHTYVGAAQKTVFNQAMPPKSAPMEKVFTDGGEVLAFRCDVHPWMAGFVSVADHPFQGVSGADGAVTINNVPSKKYTVEAWHEKLGTQSAQVTVTAGQTTELTITFKGDQAG